MANGHGGRRPGAGRPKKDVPDQQKQTDAAWETARATGFARQASLSMRDRPDAVDIKHQTIEFLGKSGCLEHINPADIDEFSVLMARWFAAEIFVTKLHVYSPIAGDVDNRESIVNPAIEVGMRYMREADTVWERIWRTVEQNAANTVDPLAKFALGEKSYG